ncbi:hypothetical protein B6U98_00520 [Thermoplasmatales archaeon ex4572_165]|nr:MAG: hypothetical protein B6U98_00520 [Thermoplasmatales archaeon ex4572_165]
MDMQISENKYRLIAENTSDLICTTTFSSKPVYTYVSPSYKKLLGYEPDEMIGKNPFEFMHPDEREKITLLLKKNLRIKNKQSLNKKETEHFERYESQIKSKSGKWYYLENTANLIGDEILFISKDITESKHLEEKFASIYALTEATLNSIENGILVIDNKGKVLKNNAKFEELWHIPKEIIEHKENEKLIDFILDQIINPEQFKTKIKKLCNNPEIYSQDILNFKDGRIFERFSRPVFIKGTPSARLLSFRDITERKKTEKEIQKTQELLQQMNEKLEIKVKDRTSDIEKLLRQKDEFVNQLGHDLKNPLGPLIQLLPILKKDVPDEKSKGIIEILIRNVTHMKNLVTKTVQLAHLNSPSTTICSDNINLLNEIVMALENNSQSLIKQNITIINNIHENIMVKADEIYLIELFNNLINNAVKYSPNGSTITINAIDDEEFITTSIKDNGMGLTNAQISHIFDEFYKADSSRHDFESSGLGLPICKRIVDKQGGRIWAESEGLGKGSTFYFTLPSVKINK